MEKYHIQYTMDDEYDSANECVDVVECNHDGLQEHIKWLRQNGAYNIQVTEEEYAI